MVSQTVTPKLKSSRRRASKPGKSSTWSLVCSGAVKSRKPKAEGRKKPETRNPSPNFVSIRVRSWLNSSGTNQIPLHQFHENLGANFTNVNDAEAVEHYGDFLAEHAAL